jgi:uncharacterized protein (TIGR03083 family)
MPVEGWERTTACAPWTVGHLVAHLTAAGNQTYRNLVGGMLASGFDLDRFANHDLLDFLTGSPSERIDRLEESVENPSTPKPLRKIVLGEMVCHGEDIRRVMGDRGEYSAEQIARVGPMFAKTKAPLDGSMRVEGLSFRADDGDWSFGSGPEVTGSGIDLVCAIAGRDYALDHLGGAGLSILRSRF